MYHRTTHPHNDFTGWHKDGPKKLNDDPNLFCAIWTSRDSTEIKLDIKGNREFFQMDPKHLYIFQNRAWLHRTPRGLDYGAPFRWFIHMFVTDADTPEFHHP
jgi:hypothetical protein